MLKMKAGKYVAIALKTAIGSCVAILAAEQFHLEFASSAGIIALLTLINTRWDTLRLSAVRLLSFFAAVLLAWMIFSHMSREWITYGVFVFLLVGISLFVGWQNTMSVNAVIGTHFWTTQDFGAAAIWNEFCLVFIGITVAVVLNLFQRNQSRKKQILQDMRYVEARLQDILEMLADYLMQRENQADVWEEIAHLEEHLSHSMERAYEYDRNTFLPHTEYYNHYIEMRTRQCSMLQSLHWEIQKIRTMPSQALTIAEYMAYMKRFVEEKNVPKKQIERLRQVEDEFHRAPLPVTREEFEGRAVLYHIMMDLEEFLLYKKRFVESLSEKQKKIYWETEKKE